MKLTDAATGEVFDSHLPHIKFKPESRSAKQIDLYVKTLPSDTVKTVRYPHYGEEVWRPREPGSNYWHSNVTRSYEYPTNSKRPQDPKGNVAQVINYNTGDFSPLGIRQDNERGRNRQPRSLSGHACSGPRLTKIAELTGLNRNLSNSSRRSASIRDSQPPINNTAPASDLPSYRSAGQRGRSRSNGFVIHGAVSAGGRGADNAVVQPKANRRYR